MIGLSFWPLRFLAHYPFCKEDIGNIEILLSVGCIFTRYSAAPSGMKRISGDTKAFHLALGT